MREIALGSLRGGRRGKREHRHAPFAFKEHHARVRLWKQLWHARAHISRGQASAHVRLAAPGEAVAVAWRTHPAKSRKPSSGKRALRNALKAALALAAVMITPWCRRIHGVVSGGAARAARALERRQGQVAFSVPIEQLGINKEEFIGERFIKSKKLLKYSEAEEEILHLEDMEMDSTWMRSARLTGLAVFVAGGMTVMGGTGKIWDTFAASQEEKEREEELRITGRFIDTTANRMDEEEKLKKKAEQRKRLEEQFSSIESDDAGESPKEKKSGPSEPPGASPSGGVDFSALDRLLGDDDE
ncbi:hypothetical protein FVE85_3792 [Porphyridium purpureum]|uniref:Uncharacterized protein n=1 Tax=Porphyridium purpureum TaxID=35688 RepID=A0A5J4YNU9_PORPP|nr:hypothetical protein FVE85_3792 [Porphyridium purpureum]|eukprot:POR7815..scf249_10